MSDCYENSLEHLLDELARIDLLIRMCVLQLRSADAGSSDEFRGLYISEEEVDGLLVSEVGKGPWAGADHPQLLRMRERATALEAHIAAKKIASRRSGVVLRMGRLASLFDLSPWEVDVLLICLAPELDLKYERFYAYLQNDVTKKRAGVDLVLNLLHNSFEDKLLARRYLSPSSPLISWYLLRLFEDPPGRQAPLLGKYLKVDERIVDYLLGSDECDSRLSSWVQMINPTASSVEPISEGELTGKLLPLARRNAVFFFQGGYGVGKKRRARAICRDMGKRLLAIDLARMLEGELPFSTAIRLAFREALLQDAATYWDHFDLLLDEGKGTLRREMAKEIEARTSPGQNPTLTFLAGERSWEPVGAMHEVPLIRVNFPTPSYKARKKLWEMHLNGRFRLDDGVDIGALANKFRFSEGQIHDAVSTARNLALGRGEEQIAMVDIYEACRAHSNQKLTHLARKVRPHYTWVDIVLPPDEMRQLQEIVSCVKYRPLVFGDWGFGRKLPLGKGLNALFTGPPGTGKTMAADIMAGELGLDLHKIDLSMVVSKFIGETEKNLNKIFKEAETSNSILFFDEADALFGKRSEVRDSHDRYANIEIAYLLQKMEEYDGIVILATNLRQNLDDAFVRRIHFTVEFPFPEEEYRRRIWEATFPPEAPQDGDTNLDFLARRFKLAGGNIRNIILCAAFFAAEDGRVIGMEHLIRATKREFQKMGKLVVQSDFGKYYDYLPSYQ